MRRSKSQNGIARNEYLEMFTTKWTCVPNKTEKMKEKEIFVQRPVNKVLRKQVIH
jgi:hypothetical protein